MCYSRQFINIYILIFSILCLKYFVACRIFPICLIDQFHNSVVYFRKLATFAPPRVFTGDAPRRCLYLSVNARKVVSSSVPEAR